jgi:glutathione S-transferase
MRVRSTSSAKRTTRHVTRASLMVPDAYGYVLGSISATCLTLYWMSFQVAFARRKFGVSYPKMYAEGDDENAVGFNCVQRGHQNSLELAPQALVCQMLLGLKFPVTAAVLGVAWAIGRIVYFRGYATGVPKNRVAGAAISGLVWLALVFGTAYAGFTMVRVVV